MLTGRILFMETSEIGTLIAIFRLLGTPSPDLWPSLTRMTHFKTSFPRFQPGSVSSKLVGIQDEKAIDLLEKMLQMNPAHRLTAQQCLQHPYFAGLDFDSL